MSSALPPPLAIPYPLLGHAESIRNRRQYQEDRFAFHEWFSNNQRHHFVLFGVFDGHGGDEVSSFLQRHMPSCVERHFASFSDVQWTEQHVAAAARAACNEMQSTLKAIEFIAQRHVGSTANVVLLVDDLVICINVGDSRAVLCMVDNTSPADAEHHRVAALSSDHKPSAHDEQTRIFRAGGYVAPLPGSSTLRAWSRANPTIDVGLSVSRSFGDFYAAPIVTHDPSISIADYRRMLNINDASENDVYIVLASDGLWDVVRPEEVAAWGAYFYRMSNDMVVDTLECIRQGRALEINPYARATATAYTISRARHERFAHTQFARFLVDQARQRRSSDNITVAVINVRSLPATPG